MHDAGWFFVVNAVLRYTYFVASGARKICGVLSIFYPANYLDMCIFGTDRNARAQCAFSSFELVCVCVWKWVFGGVMCIIFICLYESNWRCYVFCSDTNLATNIYVTQTLSYTRSHAIACRWCGGFHFPCVSAKNTHANTYFVYLHTEKRSRYWSQFGFNIFYWIETLDSHSHMDSYRKSAQSVTATACARIS